MQISVWGNELSAWVARAQLAAYGNHVIHAINETEPTSSELRSEPNLIATLKQAVFHERFVCDEKRALASEVHWIAMAPDETPRAVELVTQLAKEHEGPLLIVNQSNFGVGISDHLQSLLQAKDQHVLYMPDLLQAGSAIQQFAHPEALLIGHHSTPGSTQLIGILRPFHLGQRSIQLMTRREAEFVKYAITGILALRLGYINELASLCDQLGIDIDAIRRGMSADKRIGTHYLQPGCGFGGLQFTQYLKGLAQLLSEKQSSVLMDTVLKQNEINKEWPFRTLWQYYNCDIKGKTFAIWGAAFKSGVADIDNSPTLRVIDALLAQGAKLKIHDPEALEALAKRYLGITGLELCAVSYEACEQADGLLVLTAWPEYASPDFKRIYHRMNNPLIIDGRNLYDPIRVQQSGFHYFCLGRSCLSAPNKTSEPV